MPCSRSTLSKPNRVSEQALSVPAVALLTRRRLDSVPGEEVGIAMTGVLPAAIATEDQDSGGEPAVPRHVELAAGQIRCDRPPMAQPTMPEQVQHHGMV